MFINTLTLLFQFWITTDWYVALLMSFGVNLFTYFFVASLLVTITTRLNISGLIGKFQDTRPLYKNQVRTEIFYGVIACLVFSATSLLTRVLYDDIWPKTFVSLFVQLVAFAIFYETYSYFVHRLLHLKIFRSVHVVHHKSVRVTPWSAYSVHPIEAMFIGISAPAFMLLFQMSLAVVLVYHIVGMAFTMFIHSNFKFHNKVILSSVLNAYTTGHAIHHRRGSVNFGFVSPLWDMAFKTSSSDGENL